MDLSKSGKAYRSEINGLRCIAVLAVVFYHFGVPRITGGFVGVDVFFVISGFLIGGILWRELVSSGRIALGRFYLRRLRRLAPAYFAMIIVSLLFGYAILLPFEFREFGKSIIASTVYLSNVLFFRQAGYFDTAAEEKTLLHTWSLSVEEQFYIFLPVLILLVGRRHLLLKSSLVVILIASLVACILVTQTSQTAAFYLFPFRAWELLAGVLLAIYGQVTRTDWQFQGWISWAGLALVLAAVFLINPGEGFPGVQAVIPVLGTLLLILNGRHNNLVNQFLSAPPLVFIGLISYSLYLWHWPILTLSQYWRGGYSGTLEVVLWLTITFAVAAFSWRFVEQPFRQPGFLSAPKLVGAAVILSGAMLMSGGVLYKTNGLPNRFSSDARIYIDASTDFLQDWSRCKVEATGPMAGQEVCRIGPEGIEPTVLIWGDSHLRAFMDGLAQSALEHQTAGLLVWRAGCPPVFGLSKSENTTTPQEDIDCIHATHQMRAALSKMPSIRRLMLVGRWSYYAEGRGIGLDAENTITLRVLSETLTPDVPQSDVFGLALTNTVRELSPYFDQILVLRQLPEIPNYDSRQVARALVHGRMGSDEELEAILQTSIGSVAARTEASEEPLNKLAAAGDIILLDSWEKLCTADKCSVMHGGKLLYFDNNHVTNLGARTLRYLFDPLFVPTSDQVTEVQE